MKNEGMKNEGIKELRNYGMLERSGSPGRRRSHREGMKNEGMKNEGIKN